MHRAPDFQPILSDALIEARPLTSQDFDCLYAVASDRLIWEQHPARDRYQEPVFREFFREALDSGGALLVFDRASGAVIGSSRYFGHDAERREVEIGWTFLARSHWGGRYNQALKRLMLDHVYQYVDSVVFLVGPDNMRSQTAVRRIGGRQVGTRRDATGRTSLVFRLTAPECRQGPGDS